MTANQWRWEEQPFSGNANMVANTEFVIDCATHACDRMILSFPSSNVFRWLATDDAGESVGTLSVAAGSPMNPLENGGYRQVAAREQVILEVKGGARFWKIRAQSSAQVIYDVGIAAYPAS